MYLALLPCVELSALLWYGCGNILNLPRFRNMGFQITTFISNDLHMYYFSVCIVHNITLYLANSRYLYLISYKKYILLFFLIFSSKISNGNTEHTYIHFIVIYFYYYLNVNVSSLGNAGHQI